MISRLILGWAVTELLTEASAILARRRARKITTIPAPVPAAPEPMQE